MEVVNADCIYGIKMTITPMVATAVAVEPAEQRQEIDKDEAARGSTEPPGNEDGDATS